MSRDSSKDKAIKTKKNIVTDKGREKPLYTKHGKKDKDKRF